MSIQVPLLVIDQTCLVHVYIVLEPVGSTRLKFGDDQYYEFLCFDVPKIVRSPGCDHGHDEESRNGRDINIGILDDYIRTPDEFRGSPDIYRSARGLLESLGELMGQHGSCVCVRERRGPRAGRAPPTLGVRIGQGGRRPLFPPSLPLLASPFPLPSRTRKG